MVLAMLQEDRMVLGACHVTRGHDGACDGGIGHCMAVQAMLQEDTMVLVTVGWANGGAPGAGHVTRGHDGACDGGIGEWRCMPFYKRTSWCL